MIKEPTIPVILIALVLVAAGCSPAAPQPQVTPAPTLETAMGETPVAKGTPTSQPTPTTGPIEQTTSGSGNADVTYVVAEHTDGNTWTFRVTVRHPDTGWEDYADGWDVVTPDGQVLKPDPQSSFTRTLLHPHENEQPFTRSQSGIQIPPEIDQVTVRAHDLVDGFGGQEVVVDLTKTSGENFEVSR